MSVTGGNGRGRLVLVRHGESEWNVERRIQGQSGTGLSERGRAQAERTAEVLVAAYPGAALASSDLQRCRETVGLFEQASGNEARLTEGLRERHFGRWTGMLAEEVRRDDHERWERWRHGEDVVAEVGGESTPDLAGRVTSTIAGLLEDVAGGVLICVTHGGPVWHGTHALLGLDGAVLGGVANASVTELDVDGGGSRLVSWNQVTHLPVELRELGGGRGRGTAGDEEHDAPVTGR